MVKRIPILTILVVLCFGLSFVFAQNLNPDPNKPLWPDFRSSIPSAPDDDEFDDDDEFADDLAGSYYLEGTLSLLDPEGNTIVDLPLVGLQTFGADGTLISTDTGSFVNPANPQSPGHGAWIRTGPLQVTNTGWIFLFGGFEGVPCPDPPPPLPYCLLAVPVGTYDFDPGFETGTTTFETRIWLAGTNPAEDDPLVPWPTASGVATLTRVQVPD